MAARVRPANAGAITRMLVKAGYRRSEFHRSGMVRGYGHSTEGFRSEQGLTYTTRRVQRGTYADRSPRYVTERTGHPTGKVYVDYVLGSYYGGKTEDSLAKQREMLDKAAALLREKGFVVDEPEHKGTGRLVIVVYRTNEAGEVVKS